jgi:hypothetical protein
MDKKYMVTLNMVVQSLSCDDEEANKRFAKQRFIDNIREGDFEYNDIEVTVLYV